MENKKNKFFSRNELKSIDYNSVDELINNLLMLKLIIPLGKNTDIEDYYNIQDSLNYNNIGILYLMMNDACNLNCKYCYVENEMYSTYHYSRMKFEVAKKGIDLFAKCLEKGRKDAEPQIIFYGGEPLTNMNLIKRTLFYICQQKNLNNLPYDTTITINTNGTLINDEFISLVKDINSLNVAISLDGPEEIHNKTRKYHNGTGSFYDIIKGYDLLRENNISVGFCCTISKYNIDELEDISKWFVENLNVKYLGFNILKENKEIDKVRGDSHDYAVKVSKKIINCFKYFREKGVYEDSIMRKVNAFVDGSIYFYDCGGCGQQIVVEPSGLIGVCQGYCLTKKYFVKPDNTFDPLNHPYWNKWKLRSPLFMFQCKKCIALSICGGGCPLSAEKRNKDIFALDDIYCEYAKLTTEFLIKELISQFSRKDKDVVIK